MKNEKSKAYETFLTHYVTGNPMIRGRREEDITVWERMEGDKLEAAKLKIINDLHKCDESYITAASIFRDDRAIAPLTTLAKTSKNDYCKLYAAKVLYNWKGYKDYLPLLHSIFKKASRNIRLQLSLWIQGLDEENALHFFWLAFNDSDSFVRYCSYGSLQLYYGIHETRKDGYSIKYFTDDEVYEDKNLFQERKEELKTIIETWKV